MANPAWPSSLPQNQFIGVADERQKGALRTAMDAGPAKQRRRFSAAVRTITCPVEMSSAQKAVFDTFFITTLAEGALPFTWTDPNTDATQNFRFIAPPKFTLDVGGAPAVVAPPGDPMAQRRLWKASLPLEILP